MIRQPVVAGRFYDAQPDALEASVQAYLKRGQTPQGSTRLVMAPHAGYVFSGGVAGKTIGSAHLADTMLLLGPNHTGQGALFSMWHDGTWNYPGGKAPIDEALARALLEAEPRITPDRDAHVGEHSLEVLVPFLMATNPHARIVPIAVAEHSLPTLLEVAASVGGVLANWQAPVSIVVSSDMSHYISHDAAAAKDRQAIEQILAMNPEGLYQTVQQQRISMCGVLPMTVGLAIAKRLGIEAPQLVEYATSGEVSGDFAQVVGYAGIVAQAQ